MASDVGKIHYLLRMWRSLYDYRECLTESEQEDLVELYSVLKQLKSTEREVLTRKCFHLMNIDKTSFSARVKSNSVIAEEMGITEKEFRELFTKAKKSFSELSAKYNKKKDAEEKGYIVGDLLIKIKALPSGQYGIEYRHLESDRVIKEDRIDTEVFFSSAP